MLERVVSCGFVRRAGARIERIFNGVARRPATVFLVAFWVDSGKNGAARRGGGLRRTYDEAPD